MIFTLLLLAISFFGFLFVLKSMSAINSKSFGHKVITDLFEYKIQDAYKA